MTYFKVGERAVYTPQSGVAEVVTIQQRSRGMHVVFYTVVRPDGRRATVVAHRLSAITEGNADA